MRNFLLRSVVYPNIYIALVAVMMSWEAQYLAGYYDPVYLCFIFFSTILSYSFHSVVNTVYTDISPRHEWNLNHKTVLYATILISAFTCFLIFFKYYSGYPIPFVAGAALTLAYSAPNLPGRFFELLRKIAFGKTFFLALMWTYATDILPKLAFDPDFDPISPLTGSRFYLVYAICILFDLRDRHDDQKKGIRALPTMLKNRAVMIFYWTSLLIAAFFSFMETWPSVTPTTLILLAPVIIMLFVSSLTKAQDKEIMYYIYLDGLMMLSAILHAIYFQLHSCSNNQ